MRWEKDSPEKAFFKGATTSVATYPECISFIESNKDRVYEAIRVGKKIADTLKTYPTVYGCLYYKIAELDPDEADEFFSLLQSGEGLSAKDPILLLRQYLLQSAVKTNVNPSPVWVAAVTIKAWNAWVEGREIGLLRFKSHGNTAEKFPTIHQSIESIMGTEGRL